jgi:hypothetical protein
MNARRQTHEVAILGALAAELSSRVDAVQASLRRSIENAENAGRLTGMVQGGATDQDLLKYLEWAEVECMSLGPPFGRARAERVIAAIRNLGPVDASN